MADQPEDFRDDRRRAIKLLGGAAASLMLAPYGCSRGDPDAPKNIFAAPPLANDYRFISIVRSGQGGFSGMRRLTPGVMLNDAGEVLFYAQIDGQDAYALFKLTLDYTGDKPQVTERSTVVATGMELPGGQQVRRILIADTNASGHTAFVVDGFASNNGENVVEQAPTLYVHQGRKHFERVLGLSDSAPMGGSFGAAMGDVDLSDEGNIFVVSAFATEAGDVEQGVFHLPGASLGDARILVQSGQALRGTAAINQSFGLIDARDDGHFLLQAYIQDAAMMQASPGASSAVLYQGTATAPPGSGRMMSGPGLLGADQSGPGELLLGPRAGISATGAWVEHYGEADEGKDQPQALFYSDGTQIHRIAETGEGITAFSSPALSGNGQMFYMQINEQDKPGMELKVTNGASTRTILARGQEIDGRKVSSLLHGYHSEQADSQGRVVVYAELDGEPTLLLGYPV
jgi:hypothetical protein